eukprot:gene2374-8074_t
MAGFMCRGTLRQLSIKALEPDVFTSVLSNGIKVISQPHSRGWASIAALIKVGPRYERAEYKGSSYFIEKLSFKSNEHQTHGQVLDAIHNFGGDLLTHMSKDALLHSVNFMPDQLPHVLDVLAKGIQDPIFSDEEFEEQQMMLSYIHQELQSNPTPIMHDLLHEAAFGKETLGNRSICTLETSQKLAVENIRKFYNACLQPDRITIGCTGVEHNELCNYLEQFFGSLQPSDFSILDTSSARFIGGTVHHHVDEAPVHPATQSPLAYVSLGFQSAHDMEDSFKFFVLQGLLGGGSAFSAG